MPQREPDIAYRELYGRLEPGAGGVAAASAVLASDAVMLSNLEHGAASSAGVRGLAIRYVARGCENYRIGGRGYRIEAGQVMIAPHEDGAECDIRKVERAGTLGLCTLVRGATDDFDWVFGPLVFSADCSPFGPMLSSSVAALSKDPRSKTAVARQLVGGLRDGLPRLVASVLTQAAAVAGAKPATRFEMVRRANLALAYLHATVDRTVELHELAAVVGASPFRLLAAFQQCFGETPASYHRKLRLTLALDQARARGLPISAVADDFGFCGGSSFSHAYRRAFGSAPVWSKKQAS